MYTTIAPKKYVVDGLNEVMPRFYKAVAKEGKGRQVGVFLLSSIMRHADEETLSKILADVREELTAIERGLSTTARS